MINNQGIEIQTSESQDKILEIIYSNGEYSLEGSITNGDEKYLIENGLCLLLLFGGKLKPIPNLKFEKKTLKEYPIKMTATYEFTIEASSEQDAIDKANKEMGDNLLHYWGDVDWGCEIDTTS